MLGVQTSMAPFCSMAWLLPFFEGVADSLCIFLKTLWPFLYALRFYIWESLCSIPV